MLAWMGRLWRKTASLLTLGALQAVLGCARVHNAAPGGQPVLDHELTTIDGRTIRLGDAYPGKVLLLVNTASECGYTPQYAGLETLHRRYAGKGLAVLGFPSNDFGGQEPGSDGEIRKFCSTRFNVSFDLFTKGPVKGAAAQPLWKAVAAAVGAPGWNFEKVLVDREGRIVKRFTSGVDPTGAELTAAVEAELAKPAPAAPAGKR